MKQITYTFLYRGAEAALAFALAVVILMGGNEAFISSAKAESVLDIVTEEYKQETLDMILNLNIPLSEETIQRAKNVIEADKIERYGPYEEKLKVMGVINEVRIWFSSREWYARDNSAVVRKYLTEEDIFDYALTGVADNVFCDDNGDPLFRKLNMNEKASKDCDNGIELIQEAGVTNVYESIRDSGMVVCCINEISGSTACAVDVSGVICPNMGSKELGLPDINLSYLFTKIFLVEPTFVSCLQTMGALNVDSVMSGVDFGNSCGLMKDNIGYDLVTLLDGKPFSVLVGTYSADAEIYAGYLGRSISDQQVKRQEDVLYKTKEVLGKDLVRKSE